MKVQIISTQNAFQIFTVGELGNKSKTSELGIPPFETETTPYSLKSESHDNEIPKIPPNI